MQSKKETRRLIVAMVLDGEEERLVLAGKENEKWSKDYCPFSWNWA